MCVDIQTIENFYYNQSVIVIFGGRGALSKNPQYFYLESANLRS
jgi:hypothetical protein